MSKRRELLDGVTDARELSKRIPRYKDRFDALKDLRIALNDLATITSHGRLLGGGGDAKRVASIPPPVLAAALALEPDLLLNRKKFYAWLDRHPEYQAYQRRRS